MHEKLPLLIEVAIEPKSASDADKLAGALEKLTSESTRLGMTTDSESGQTILRGTSGDDLEEAVVRLNEVDIQFDVGAPQVVYREVLKKPVTIRYVHKRQTGGTGQFALVEIEFIPQGAELGMHDRGCDHGRKY